MEKEKLNLNYVKKWEKVILTKLKTDVNIIMLDKTNLIYIKGIKKWNY